MDASSSTPNSIRTVQLDGLVLLKIIKHCQENVPKVVTGSLLGLDIKDNLEVTNCFPFPSDNNAENDEYQIEMMKCLRTVNVDNNIVGWYQSAMLGSFLNSSVVDVQYDYQKDIPSSVVIVYDPYRTSAGRLGIKAYRLTDSYMQSYKGQTASQSGSSAQNSSRNTERKTRVDWSDVFNEVQIRVHNSHLAHGFLYQLREIKSISCDFDRLTLMANPFIDKNLEALSIAIDDHTQEQGRLLYYQRQVQKQKSQQQQYLQKIKDDNEARVSAGSAPLPEEDLSKNPIFKQLPKPNRLESHLIANKIDLFCQQITSASTVGVNQLYIIDALHKK